MDGSFCEKSPLIFLKFPENFRNHADYRKNFGKLM